MRDFGGRFSLLPFDRFLGPGPSGFSHENCEKPPKKEKAENNINPKNSPRTVNS
jgi:hypothetical protein